MRKRSKTISFRLSEDLHDKLAAQGTSNGLSVGDTARAMVVSQLMGENVSQRDQFSSLQAGLDNIVSGQKASQKRLAYLLFSLLTNIGKLTAAEAKEVVRRDLLKTEEA